ncbi:MAG: helix-turn-helix transcriptional regulator [Gemmatimonadota bacterium]|nr:helix-turn-helix transcriptional regulator [Gammaproteobacteria bacterium]MDE3127702.1 helix-turn-helix transcriptional regulator [Gemmatimonadota bacterium]MDE3215830.1 helix-turn-helix transcriptional regulator [Gemmatimonadota bacterium]
MSQHSPVLCTHFHQAIELIGRRWTGAIVRVLMGGRLRYCEIRNAIPEVSDRMLSERLKELEAAGIVLRLVTPDTPVRVEYELTKKGRGLEQALAAVEAWASEWKGASRAQPRARAMRS